LLIFNSPAVIHTCLPSEGKLSGFKKYISVD